MPSLEPASAEGMVKTEIKAETKIITASFFHIKDPSFRFIYRSFAFIDGGNQGFIQI
jgi:hypothetical protein